MNKGICFHFGYVYKNIEEQVKDIKNSGFDCVIDTADPAFKKENGLNKQRMNLFKKHGLKLSSLHMRYKNELLPNFWLDNKIGDKLEKNLIKDIKFANKYGFTCVVVHLKGVSNQIGFCRLRRVLRLCEKLNIPLALENLDGNKNLLEQTFKNVKSDFLKFCYDAGHAHVFDNDYDYITKYKTKLITLHLHDNLGIQSKEQYKKIGYNSNNPDMHTLNKYGNINWESIASKLAKVENIINLDYEIKMCYRKNETAKEVLKEVYKQACELEYMIKKYKNK